MYIASPLTVTLVGLAYGRFADRISPRVIAPLTALVSAASLVGARFALGPHWLYYVLSDQEGNHFFPDSEDEFFEAKEECERLGLGCGKTSAQLVLG